MEPRTLEVGDVVQFNPETVHNKAFASCLAIVDEPKAFGAQVYVQDVGPERDVAGEQYFYRADFSEFEFVGKSVYMLEQ